MPFSFSYPPVLLYNFRRASSKTGQMFSRCETFKHLVLKALFSFFFYFDPSKFKAIVFAKTQRDRAIFPRSDNVLPLMRARVTT